MSHTPTPWKAAMQLGFPVILSSNGEKIADIICPQEKRSSPEGTQELFDNAAHIVHCVNSHEAMMEALKDKGEVLSECEEVLDVLVNLIPDIGQLTKVQHLQTALALAQAVS